LLAEHREVTMEKAAKKGESTVAIEKEPGGIKELFGRRWSDIFLAILFIYVILLGIGVFAEVFKVQSILDWWIWRAPGS
jgi:hypothetical protein